MTTPENLNYSIAGRDRIFEADGMRVQVLALADGEVIPWHWHSTIRDIFVCIDGVVVVETRAPEIRHELRPGEHVIVPPLTAHQVTGKDGGACRFTIVQGVGQHDYYPMAGHLA